MTDKEQAIKQLARDVARCAQDSGYPSIASVFLALVGRIYHVNDAEKTWRIFKDFGEDGSTLGRLELREFADWIQRLRELCFYKADYAELYAAILKHRKDAPLMENFGEWSEG